MSDEFREQRVNTFEERLAGADSERRQERLQRRIDRQNERIGDGLFDFSGGGLSSLFGTEGDEDSDGDGIPDRYAEIPIQALPGFGQVFKDSQDFFGGLTAPQANLGSIPQVGQLGALSAPATAGAIQGIQNFNRENLPRVQNFLQGQLATGGLQDTQQAIDALGRVAADNRNQILSDVRNSGLAQGTGAIDRAARQLGPSQNAFALQAAGLDLANRQQAQQNQFAAAAAIPGLANNLAMPSSIELALAGLTNQRDIANQGAQQANQAAQLQGMLANLNSALGTQSQQAQFFGNAPSIFSQGFFHPEMIDTGTNLQNYGIPLIQGAVDLTSGIASMFAG